MSSSTGNESMDLGSFEEGTGGGARASNPFTKAASVGAARRRREMQQAMKETVESTKATEAAKEQARKKKQEEEKEAAARAEIEKEVTKLIDSSDESEDGELREVARDLNKEIGSPPLKKRSREVSAKRKTTPAVVSAPPTVLRQSSFIPHNYGFARVIVEGSARLESDDKVAQFIGLVGVLLTNGKLIDPFFVLNPVIIGGGRKDLRDAKDVPQNMTTLWGYIKISERSLQTFQKKRSGGGQGVKKSGGGIRDMLTWYISRWRCLVMSLQLKYSRVLRWSG